MAAADPWVSVKRMLAAQECLGLAMVESSDAIVRFQVALEASIEISALDECERLDHAKYPRQTDLD